MKTKIIILTLILFSFNVIAQEYQDWKFVHPLPQSNNLRKIKMIDQNNWVAVGANGTFMKTSNAGANWFFHHYAGRWGADLKSSACYDIWFFNTNNGIAAGDKGYVGKTTNGGVTFDSVAIGLVSSSQRCQTIWFSDNSTGFIGAGSGSGYGATIIKTTDGGTTWAVIYTNANAAVTSICGTDASTFYALMTNGSVLKTTNSGANWAENSNAVPIYLYNISFLNSNTGFATGGAGKLRRTTNAGATWDSLSSPEQNEFAQFQVKIVSASEIYLVGSPLFLYKSTDLGNTWTNLTINVPQVSTTYIWYSVDKAGSTLVISGDYGVVAKSNDGGNTWTSSNFQLSTQIMFDIKHLTGTSKIWAVGRPYTTTTRQVFYSSNYGNNWTTYDLNTTGEFYAISMINANTGYVCGQNSKVLKTTNGGANWTLMNPPSATSYSLYSMEFINENTGWVFVNYSGPAAGGIFKTTDGCQTWMQYSHGTTDAIMSADMVDANTGFITMNPSNKPVYKTTNGGVNWTAYTTGMTGNIKTIKAVNENVIYCGTSSGTSRVAKTTNGGLNWTLITLPVAVDVTSLDFKDANTGYVCGNSTTNICRTNDGGNTWTFQNGHIETMSKIMVTQGDTAFVTGVYTSILRGVGSIMTGIKYNGNTSPANFELKQNYPNPFNPGTTIEFNIPEPAVVSLKIYDINGRQFTTDINQIQLNRGNFKYKFDASELSSGIYFYSLVVNGKIVSTKKMIFIK